MLFFLTSRYMKNSISGVAKKSAFFLKKEFKRLEYTMFSEVAYKVPDKHCSVTMSLHIPVGSSYWCTYLIQYWMPLYCWLGPHQVGVWVSPGIHSCIGRNKSNCNIFLRSGKQQYFLVTLTSLLIWFGIMVMVNGQHIFWKHVLLSKHLV
jgi:hypothetical protein